MIYNSSSHEHTSQELSILNELSIRSSPFSSGNSSSNNQSPAIEESKGKRNSSKVVTELIGRQSQRSDSEAIKSNSSVPVVQAKYCLSELIPDVRNLATDTKKLISSPNELSSARQKVIYEGELLKYLKYKQTMLLRYIVLNNRALLLYKNNVAYQSYPQKPTSVIPLLEIARVNVRNNPISHKA